MRERVTICAEAEDGDLWYLSREQFEALCEGYDLRATAQALRELGLLRHNPGRLTWRAPKRMFGGNRPQVFAILKELGAESLALRHHGGEVH